MDENELIANYDPAKNSSTNLLTRFEKTKIIGMRMEQIARGALPNIEYNKSMSVRDIVLKELQTRCLPFLICRTMPNGKKELWKLKDMVY